MSNFNILLKSHFLEFKRTHKWLVYILTFIAISLLSSVVTKYLFDFVTPLLESMGFVYYATVADAYGEFVNNMSEIGFFLITIMFSGALVKEKTSSTYYVLKSNNVTEKEIVLAHYVSKLILITGSYLISIFVFVISNLIFFKAYTGYRGVVSLSLVYLFLVFALSFAMFISSFIKKRSAGIAISIPAYLALSIIAIIPKIGIYTPFYSLTLAREIMMQSNVVTMDYIIGFSSIIIFIVGLLIGSIYIYSNKIDNRG